MCIYTYILCAYMLLVGEYIEYVYICTYIYIFIYIQRGVWGDSYYLVWGSQNLGSVLKIRVCSYEESITLDCVLGPPDISLMRDFHLV